jgi:outer membrane protein insertion porin family
VLGSAQENLEIRKIKFQGNKHFPDYRLKEEMTLESSFWIKEKIFGKEPVYYSTQLYEDDIKRLKIFYQKEGYLNVSFSPPEIIINKKKKVELRLTVNEGEPILISRISFLIDSTKTLDDVFQQREKNKLLFKTETAASQIFRDESITNDKLLIAELFNNNGYPYTSVEHKLKVDVQHNSTEVKWFVNRGPLSYFGATTIEGNNRVADKNILRQLDYSEGDVWSKTKLDQSQTQIYNQGIYRVASLRTQIDKEVVDTIPIQIQIKEAPRWSARFGAGYGKEDKLRAFTELQYLSFITNTGRLNVYAKHSSLEPYNFYLKFSQPSFLSPINTLSIYPFIQSQDEPGYKLDKMGYNITFLQNLSKQLNTSLGYIYEDVKLDTTGYSENNSSTDIESVYKKKGITIGAIYNNADPILDPIEGYAVSFNVKTNHILFSGEIPFYRILTEYKTYLGLKKGVVLALKAKIGGIKRSDNETYIPVDEKFFAGGSHSVRGWSRSDLGPHDDDGTPTGGNSIFESSTEFRFDIGKKLKLNLFLDAGNVWENSFSYRINDLHYASGFGIRIKTPIGPAGIDFARPIFDDEKSWQIHFNIGHSF